MKTISSILISTENEIREKIELTDVKMLSPGRNNQTAIESKWHHLNIVK